MAYSAWRVAAAAVRGTGHDETGSPCQDACAVRTSTNGEWIALVASDGAGTAANSQISSRYVADAFADALMANASRLQTQSPGAWLTDAVIQQVLDIRNALRAKAGSDDINSYHCTLVAALVGPSGGIAVHLGDGAVFGGVAAPGTPRKIDLASDYFLSQPQNGEYANETVFLTEKDWIKNIRIAPLATVDWVVLGTDGGMALAMVHEKLPKTGFVAPVLHVVQQHNDNDTRNNKLLAILSDPQANKLTNDDKTLVVAVRATCMSASGAFRAPISAQKSISTNGFTSATTPVASSNTLAGFSQRGITEGNAPQAAVKLKSVKKRWLLRRSVFIPAIALLFFSLTLGIYWATISIWAKTSPVVKTVKQDPSQKDPAVLAVPQLPAAAAPATPQNPASMPTGDKAESVPRL